MNEKKSLVIHSIDQVDLPKDWKKAILPGVFAFSNHVSRRERENRIFEDIPSERYQSCLRRLSSRTMRICVNDLTGCVGLSPDPQYNLGITDYFHVSTIVQRKWSNSKVRSMKQSFVPMREIWGSYPAWSHRLTVEVCNAHNRRRLALIQNRNDPNRKKKIYPSGEIHFLMKIERVHPHWVGLTTSALAG